VRPTVRATRTRSCWGSFSNAALWFDGYEPQQFDPPIEQPVGQPDGDDGDTGYVAPPAGKRVTPATPGPTSTPSKLRTRLECNGTLRWRERLVHASAPSNCVMLPESASMASAAPLRRLRWKGSATATATATGRIAGTHRGDPVLPVRVTASQRRYCGPGGATDRDEAEYAYYARVRVTVRGHSWVLHPDNGCGWDD
jgi:hypothetical protein